jgi:hypothetical protein
MISGSKAKIGQRYFPYTIIKCYRYINVLLFLTIPVKFTVPLGTKFMELTLNFLTSVSKVTEYEMDDWGSIPNSGIIILETHNKVKYLTKHHTMKAFLNSALDGGEW